MMTDTENLVWVPVLIKHKWFVGILSDCAKKFTGRRVMSSEKVRLCLVVQPDVEVNKVLIVLI